MRHSPRPHVPGRLLGSGAAVLMTLGLLAACGDDDAPAPQGSSASASDATTDPSSSSPASPTQEPSEPSGVSVVPAYYVGDTPQGDRLYREFTQLGGLDPLVGAAAAVTEGDPVDPDYRTLWPAGRFASVTRSGEAIVAELPDKTWLEAGDAGPQAGVLAVQQLVYTLQGVVGERLPVRVELGGKPAATLLGVPVGDGLTALPELDVLALANITEPAEGSAVGAKFTAEGRASSFEATVLWEIRDATGEVVLDGFATAEGWLDKLYPWRTDIDASDLTPGSYTFKVSTDDPSGGAEGTGPTLDTKRITIQ